MHGRKQAYAYPATLTVACLYAHLHMDVPPLPETCTWKAGCVIRFAYVVLYVLPQNQRGAPCLPFALSGGVRPSDHPPSGSKEPRRRQCDKPSPRQRKFCGVCQMDLWRPVSSDSCDTQPSNPSEPSSSSSQTPSPTVAKRVWKKNGSRCQIHPIQADPPHDATS